MTTSDVLRHRVGTGGFRFVRWDAGSRIEVIADTANYRGRAKLDRVIFVTDQTPPAATTAVLNRETVYFAAFPIAQASRLDPRSEGRGLSFVPLACGQLGLRVRGR